MSMSKRAYKASEEREERLQEYAEELFASLKATAAACLTLGEAMVLEALCDPEQCKPFDTLMDDTELSRDHVRAACRSLASRGYAEFHRGLWSYSGAPAGAGYCISPAGEKLRDTMADARALIEMIDGRQP